MNNSKGFSKKDDFLSLRFLTEGRKCDVEQRTVPLASMLKEYYKLRGYDANGVTSKKTMARQTSKRSKNRL